MIAASLRSPSCKLATRTPRENLWIKPFASFSEAGIPQRACQQSCRHVQFGKQKSAKSGNLPEQETIVLFDHLTDRFSTKPKKKTPSQKWGTSVQRHCSIYFGSMCHCNV